MLIPRPKTPEELYRFFIKGLPREPVNFTEYMSIFRRRGWNILTDGRRDDWLIPITYYSNWKHDKPDWVLSALKYQ